MKINKVKHNCFFKGSIKSESLNSPESKMKKLAILIIFVSTLSVFSQELNEKFVNHFYSPSPTQSDDHSFINKYFSIQVDQKLDSIIAIGLSGDKAKSVYTYDGEKVILAEKSFLEDSNWILAYRVLLTYNDQDQILEEKTQALINDSIWINDRRKTYEYNESNKLASSVNQIYDNGNWNDFQRALFSYPNNVEEELRQQFDSGVWVNKTLFRKYIGDNGNRDSTFVYQRGDTTWNNYLRWYRHYNEFNKWDYVITQQWLNSSWIFQDSIEGIYDANGNLLQVNYYDWSNQFEELISRLLYTYNSEGNLSEVYNEFITVDGWFPAQMDPIVIDITDDYTEGYLYNRVKLYHSPISSVKDDEVYTNFSLHQNYPNPFNPTTTIQYQVSGIGNVTLKVYDILGRQIKTLLNKPMQPGSYEVEFDGSNLTSGVYFYVLETGGKRLSKKMLLVK